ncbi:MAG: dihydropteroate synthase [Synergistales bacterium]|nr:dihydropteroate synthase [Synergistales bacterium]
MTRPILLSFADEEEFLSRLRSLGCDPGGLPYFLAKEKTFSLLLKAIDTRAANALKQEMLSRGGDAAVHRNAIDRGVERTDCILFGNEKQLCLLVEKLKAMPYWGLDQIRRDLEEALLSMTRPAEGLDLPRGRRLTFGARTLVMGILNVTSDSFYPGSRIGTLKELIDRAGQMVDEGVDIIDIGAESTRPGSESIDETTERKRLIPAIETLRERFPDLPLSADTYKAAIAEEAVAAGADIINDISGFGFDRAFAERTAALGVPVVLMHIKGHPRDMQKNPCYNDLLPEIAAFLEERLDLARQAGIDRKRIVIDPGIGFGKTPEHNLEILRHLEAFRTFGLPLLIGHSRKSFLGAVLDQPSPEERLEGTMAVSALCAWQGVEIIRVHDVGANRKVLDTIAAVRGTR